MLQSVGIFLLFLTPLIFFHELGHFLFARFFGVRVETFSIGFGPKIFKRTWGQTEYAISVIPLGGYIKMFGDDPLAKDDVAEADRAQAFVHQGKWARFWIVFGGPLANFLLAFALFFGLLFFGEKVPELRVGRLEQESKAYSFGLRSADVLKKVNGKAVLGLTDLSTKLNEKEISSVEVERLGEKIALNSSMSPTSLVQALTSRVGPLRIPLVTDDRARIFAVSLSPDQVNWSNPLEAFFVMKAPFTLHLFELKGEGKENYDSSGNPVIDPKLKREIKIEGEDVLAELARYRLFPKDLRVKSVVSDSPVAKAGLKAQDVIFSLNRKVLTSFEDLRSEVQSFKGKDPVQIKYYRSGEPVVTELTFDDVLKEGEERKIGVYSDAEVFRPKFVNSEPLGLFSSLTVGAKRTWEGIVATFGGFMKLMTHKASLKNVGGPIAIGKVASDSFRVSFSYFIGLMALVSINLGIINLFPIPVLDGGHILFIGLEMINRKPLSRKTLEIAHQGGFSLLLLLIVAALWNDVMRILS